MVGRRIIGRREITISRIKAGGGKNKISTGIRIRCTSRIGGLRGGSGRCARPTERYLFLPVLRQLPLRKRKIVRELSKTCFLILGKPGRGERIPGPRFQYMNKIASGDMALIKPIYFSV